MTELLHNAWLIVRILLLILYCFGVLGFLIITPSIVGGAPGRLKLIAIPVGAVGVFWAAALPMVSRALDFP